jgi:hypothetical protein
MVKLKGMLAENFMICLVYQRRLKVTCPISNIFYAIFHKDLLQHLPGILALFYEISARDRAIDCLEIFLRYLFNAGSKLNKQDLQEVVTTAFPEGGVTMSTIAQQLIEEGRKQEILDSIELGLELKFGAEGLHELSEIRKIKNLKLLSSIRQAIRTASTIDVIRRIYLKNKEALIEQ